MRTDLFLGLAALAGAVSAPAAAAEAPFFTAADGTAWSLDRSTIQPLAVGPGTYQFWMTGTTANNPQVRQYKVRIYLDCRSKWSVTSALAYIDPNGATIDTTYKGWGERNWVKPDPAGVIANAAKLVCPAP